MAISQKLLNEGEKVLLSMRQHPKALFPPLFVLVLLLAVGVAVQVLIDQEVVTLVTWIVLGLAIAWYVVRPFLLWLTAVHAITDRRIITRWGILTRRGHDIPLKRISDMSIEINLIDRPFGCGTLIITNASTDGNVHLHDIPRVEQTKLLIHNLVNDIQDPSPRADEGV
ncbi:PH domain-containing protein [Nocardioides sp. SYSU D00038]|uniref:PH domain-containing protein n=1 Tax=Nocardioides sp. SYSU D00038 TaxID=2812554 RepID=UPI0019677B80|nr:PH domain-containing protein [Nocardioides sp. SYSU D00038]